MLHVLIHLVFQHFVLYQTKLERNCLILVFLFDLFLFLVRFAKLVLQFFLQRHAKKKDAGEQQKTAEQLQLDAMNAKLDRMQQSLDKHIAMDDERAAKQRRMRVLRFNEEVILQQPHTKEHFDEILDDITEYERYCHEHPLYKNNKAKMAIANVIQAYQKCEDENSFL